MGCAGHPEALLYRLWWVRRDRIVTATAVLRSWQDAPTRVRQRLRIELVSGYTCFV